MVFEIDPVQSEALRKEAVLFLERNKELTAKKKRDIRMWAEDLRSKRYEEIAFLKLKDVLGMFEDLKFKVTICITDKGVEEMDIIKELCKVTKELHEVNVVWAGQSDKKINLKKLSTVLSKFERIDMLHLTFPELAIIDLQPLNSLSIRVLCVQCYYVEAGLECFVSSNSQIEELSVCVEDFISFTDEFVDALAMNKTLKVYSPRFIKRLKSLSRRLNHIMKLYHLKRYYESRVHPWKSFGCAASWTAIRNPSLSRLILKKMTRILTRMKRMKNQFGVKSRTREG